MEALTNILNNILKVDSIEEAFSCFLVHKPSSTDAQIQQELINVFKTIPQDQLDYAIRNYLNITSSSSRERMKSLIKLLEFVVKNNGVEARSVCEVLKTHEKLVITNHDFWLECFKLLYRIIDLVDYKGVREIMKVGSVQCMKL